MRLENCISADRKSVASTIAWLSLCLLAAGWGPACDPEIRRLWALAGAFGLSAALGFDVVRRARAALRRRGLQELVQQRIMRSLEPIAAPGDPPADRGSKAGLCLDDVMLRGVAPRD